jgi:hypothetical protein
VIIVFGKKKKRKSLGYVADLCPICRSIKPMALTKISVASHVYYVSLGQGKSLGFLATCDECGYVFETDYLRYKTVQKKRVDDLRQLIHQTNPTIHEVHAERLELEDRVKRNARFLDKETRKKLIIEPFVLLNPLYEDIMYGETKFDKTSSLGCLGAFLISVLAFVIAFLVPPALKESAGVASLVIPAAAFIVALVIYYTAPFRLVKSEYMPRLLRALKPLQPTIEELHEVKRKLTDMQFRSGRKLDPQKIYDQLVKPETGPPT